MLSNPTISGPTMPTSTMPDSYVFGLSNFLKYSNEDTLETSVLAERLPMHASKTLQGIRNEQEAWILDVGAGNGKKTRLLVDFLRKEDPLFTLVDSIEPMAEQRSLLKSTLHEAQYSVARTYQDTFAVVAPKLSARFHEKFPSEKPGSGVYDFACFFHSLYQFPQSNGLLPDLLQLPKLLAPDGAAIILHQAPESDSRRLRDDLFPKMFEDNGPVTYEQVRASLENAGLRLVDGGELVVPFTYSRSADSMLLGRQFSFLLMNKLDLSCTAEQYRTIGAYVRKNFSGGKLRSVDKLLFAFPS